MVAAGAQAPNRCQAISNSHGDWPNTVVPQIMSCGTLTVLQTLYKLWSSETWRSGTRYFLCKWWVHLLTPITLSATLLRHRANARLCWQRQQPHSTGKYFTVVVISYRGHSHTCRLQSTPENRSSCHLKQLLSLSVAPDIVDMTVLVQPASDEKFFMWTTWIHVFHFTNFTKKITNVYLLDNGNQDLYGKDERIAHLFIDETSN